MPTVTIAGTEPEALIDVSTTQAAGAELGKAAIVVGSTPQNRRIGSGEVVRVLRGGEVEFLGYTTARPARTSQGTLEIEALDPRYELKKESVNRVFYDMDSGAIVREMVDHRATALDERLIHDGSDLGGWESNTPYFSLCNFSSRKLHEYGTDLLFVGLPENASGLYRVTYSGVPSATIPGDGQLLKLMTRMLENDDGDQITTTAELRDGAGNSYVWEIPTRSTFETHELLAEEASADGNLSGAATFEYRFEIEGSLVQDTGIAIDHAATVPFDLQPRGTELAANAVQETGRKITRRAEKSALELIQDLETEDGYLSWADTENNLHYEPAGEPVEGLTITYDETLIADAQFATDYDTVTNKVIVKGSDDVQVTRSDPASIRYYGLAERTEPIVDQEIQTAEEAAARAEGFLDEHAWTDTVATFVIADTDFEAARAGMAIPVEWPPQGLSGLFEIESKQISAAGVVTLGIGAQI